MRTIRVRNATALALMSVVLFAGCASPTVAPQVPASPEIVETPSPNPTPTSPPRLPAMEDLVITPAGIGSLLIGKPLSDTDMVRFDPEYCVETFAVTGETRNPGKWVANYPKTDHDGHPFDAHIKEDVVFSIEVTDPTLRTSNGIGVGSSIRDLTAAYPSLTPGRDKGLSKALVLATESGEIVFEVANAHPDVDWYYADTVVALRLFPPGLADDTILVYGTDGGYNSCLGSPTDNH